MQRKLIGPGELCERIQRLLEWHRCFDICFGGAGADKSISFTMAIDLIADVVVFVRVEVLNGIY